VNARRDVNNSPTVSDVWRLMMETLQGQWKQAAAVLQKVGLTPGHLRVLMLLSSGEPRPMGALAHSMTCDASTMTWLVDRMEERGLVERRTNPTDRRVKAIALTSKGRQMVAKLQKRLYEPPKALATLDRDALDSLYEVFSALAADRDEGPKARHG
jgi:DNA-binding MarR family transcriptional regulator